MQLSLQQTARRTIEMLQDVFAWDFARQKDIGRLAVAAGYGMIGRDAMGTMQIPDELKQQIMRPFPGTNIVLNQQSPAPAPATSTPTAPPSMAAAQTDAAAPSPAPPPSSLPGWAKAATFAAAMLGSGGIGAAALKLVTPAAPTVEVQPAPQPGVQLRIFEPPAAASTEPSNG